MKGSQPSTHLCSIRFINYKHLTPNLNASGLPFTSTSPCKPGQWLRVATYPARRSLQNKRKNLCKTKEEISIFFLTCYVLADFHTVITFSSEPANSTTQNIKTQCYCAVFQDHPQSNTMAFQRLQSFSVTEE